MTGVLKRFMYIICMLIFIYLYLYLCVFICSDRQTQWVETSQVTWLTANALSGGRAAIHRNLLGLWGPVWPRATESIWSAPTVWRTSRHIHRRGYYWGCIGDVYDHLWYLSIDNLWVLVTTMVRCIVYGIFCRDLVSVCTPASSFWLWLTLHPLSLLNWIGTILEGRPMVGNLM